MGVDEPVRPSAVALGPVGGKQEYRTLTQLIFRCGLDAIRSLQRFTLPCTSSRRRAACYRVVGLHGACRVPVHSYQKPEDRNDGFRSFRHAGYQPRI
jgi:hypothetical protein